MRDCSWASPGCDRCYAEQIAKRFGKKGQPYEGTYHYEADGWSGILRFIRSKLDEPLKTKAPQLVFANSMSDICHPEVKPEWDKAIMEIVCATQRHFYMFLMKRPHLIGRKILPYYTDFSDFAGEPLPNLAVGTSIASEKFLHRGYRLLEQWPGRCFLSVEPPSIVPQSQVSATSRYGSQNTVNSRRGKGWEMVVGS